jgi:hypothetical protein
MDFPHHLLASCTSINAKTLEFPPRLPKPLMPDVWAHEADPLADKLQAIVLANECKTLSNVSSSNVSPSRSHSSNISQTNVPRLSPREFAHGQFEDFRRGRRATISYIAHSPSMSLHKPRSLDSVVGWDEATRRKQEANCLAAQKSRQRKKEKDQELVETVKQLQGENERLKVLLGQVLSLLHASPS